MLSAKAQEAIEKGRASKLQQAIADHRAKRTTEEAKASDGPDPSTWEGLPGVEAAIVPPDPANTSWQKFSDDVNGLIDSLGVVEAYRVFIGKSPLPKPRGGQTESIMMRCPFPHHEDKNPSAWANSNKNTWECGTCHKGGNVWTLAAIGLGVPLDYMKPIRGKDFVDVMLAVGKHYGIEPAPEPTPVVMEPTPSASGADPKVPSRTHPTGRALISPRYFKR